MSMRLQADVQNLTNRLNLIDFAGLFSGNAIAPPRSYSIRFETAFSGLTHALDGKRMSIDVDVLDSPFSFAICSPQ